MTQIRSREELIGLEAELHGHSGFKKPSKERAAEILKIRSEHDRACILKEIEKSPLIVFKRVDEDAAPSWSDGFTISNDYGRITDVTPLRPKGKEWAKLIVHAVNCHDELVGALQASQDRLADYLAVQNIRNDNSQFAVSIATIRLQLDINTEALRKATQ